MHARYVPEADAPGVRIRPRARPGIRGRSGRLRSREQITGSTGARDDRTGDRSCPTIARFGLESKVALSAPRSVPSGALIESCRAAFDVRPSPRRPPASAYL